MLRHGADPKVAATLGGESVLEMAAQSANWEMAQLLIAAGAPINERVFEAAGRSGSLAIVRLFESHEPAGTGAALAGAAAWNRFQLAEALLHAGAEPNARDCEGATALQRAEEQGDREMARLLTNRARAEDPAFDPTPPR
jgi:ankyrin repeat protein